MNLQWTLLQHGARSFRSPRLSIPNPPPPFFDLEDRSLHGPADMPVIQSCNRPANQYYNQYNYVMEKDQSRHRGFDMEMNANRKVEEQGHLDIDQTTQHQDPSYPQLIHQALMSVEGHRILLKDIYQWIADNTDKGTDPDYALW